MKRRKFLKRSGGATAATVLAWHQLAEHASAQEGNSGQQQGGVSGLHDIYYRAGICQGTYMGPPPGSNLHGYVQSPPYQLTTDPPFTSNPPNPVDLKYTLNIWYTPLKITPHSLTMKAKYYGLLSGTWRKTAGVITPTTINIRTDQREFVGVCDPANGDMTPSDGIVNPAGASSTSSIYTSNGVDYRVRIEIPPAFISMVPAPPAKGNPEIKLLGQLKATLEKRTPAGSGNPWVELNPIANQSKDFVIKFKSHLHP